MRVARLEQLPQRVDSLTGQILQLQAEMRSEFSAIRSEMRDMGDGRIRNELIERIGEMQAGALKEIVGLDDRVDRGFAAMRQDIASFRHQMVAGLKAIQNRLLPR